MEKVYIIVDENNVTVNVFTSLGMAIADIELNKQRIVKENHDPESTLTNFMWGGRDGKKYSLTIKECPICTNPQSDFMCKPREVNEKL